MLAIGEALTARAHEVTVLGQTSVGARARAAGCEFIALNGPDYATDRPLEEQLEAVLAVMTGRGPGDDLRSVIAARGAEAVIVDCNLAGAAAAAEASGCRSGILLHSMYKTYVDTWFGELWPYLASAINDTRAVFGLDPRESWTDVFRSHDRLYAAVPEVFDAPTALAPPPSLQHTGFLVPAAHPSDRPPRARRADEHAVLVSLSTTEWAKARCCRRSSTRSTVRRCAPWRPLPQITWPLGCMSRPTSSSATTCRTAPSSRTSMPSSPMRAWGPWLPR